MREIRLAHLDRTRPVVILTREAARPWLTKVTVAAITSTVKGLSSEVPLDHTNGLDHACAVSLDNVVTIPADRLGRHIGYLHPSQELRLARAMTFAFGLELPLFPR